MTSELKRRENNKDRVLDLLQKRGSRGASNGDLLGVGGFRYGARLFELRKEGWDIETVQGDAGAFTFVLRGRVVEQKAFQFSEATQ